jgi:ubiquinone/menaquinone biosynthesis C-methylase UbiE
MKDLFSQYSKEYAAFRPTYPKELFGFIFNHVTNFDMAWDCATGNGQAAKELASRFKKVYATDISEKQLENAPQRDTIVYSVSRAEKTSFPANSFDLITVAQAIHWFDFDLFYKEAERVAKPNAAIAIWGYGLLSIDPIIDKKSSEFYKNVIGPYWDKERRFIDEKYQTIPFPFEEVKSPELNFTLQWTIEELQGYLSTWSAVQKFIKANQIDPVKELIDSIKPNWSGEKQGVRFPLFLRVGTIRK